MTKPRERIWVVFWWMSQSPYASAFTNKEAAEAAANVRNALLVEFSGHGVKIDSVNDYFRRKDDGTPMPADWRDLVGNVQMPWTRRIQDARQQ